MTLTITLNLDNASFGLEDPGCATPQYACIRETMRILSNQVPRKLLEQLQRPPGCVCTSPESADKLLDSNGNTVGTLTLDR